MTTSGLLPATPYINGGLILNRKEAVGRTVRVIGKVLGSVGNRLQIEATDGRTLTIVRPKDVLPISSRYVCVTGTVQADFSILEGTLDEFGDNFNLQHFNKVIEFSQDAPNAFQPL